MRSPRASTLALQTSPWISAGGLGTSMNSSSLSDNRSTRSISSAGIRPASWATFAMYSRRWSRKNSTALHWRIGLIEATDERVTLVAVGGAANVVQRCQELCGVVFGFFRETASSFYELHQEQRLGAVIDLGDGKIALLPQVAEHVRLALQVRLALTIYLGDERDAILQLDLVDVTDAASTHRAGALQALSKGNLYPFGD